MTQSRPARPVVLLDRRMCRRHPPDTFGMLTDPPGFFAPLSELIDFLGAYSSDPSIMSNSAGRRAVRGVRKDLLKRLADPLPGDPGYKPPQG